MKKTVSALIISLIFGVAACSTAKVTNTEVRKPASEDGGALKEAGDTLSEVFLKGSIDGKHMFMVFGVKDAAQMSKEMIHDIAVEKDFERLGDHIYNKEHKKDAYARFKNSYDGAKEVIPDLFKGPWKSIKKIPHAYKVSFERGQAAYYNSKNPIAGALKYSGWAVWANVRGAYYLIIEAPAEAALAAVAVPAVGVIPATQEAFVVAWDATKIVCKLGFEGVALAAVNSYAFVSSSTATLATAVAAGAVATYKGGKWLVYGLPHRFGYPIAVELVTDLKTDEQENAAHKIVDLFEKDGIQKNIHLQSQVGKYRSKLVMMGENDDGTQVNMGEILVNVEKTQVTVTVEFKRTYIKALMKEKGISKAEAKDMLNDEAVALTEIIRDKLAKK